MSFDLVVVGGCASKVLGSRGSRESQDLTRDVVFHRFKSVYPLQPVSKSGNVEAKLRRSYHFLPCKGIIYLYNPIYIILHGHQIINEPLFTRPMCLSLPVYLLVLCLFST